MEHFACRICGRNDWKAETNSHRLTSRAIHESGHVRRGEARWTGPLVKGVTRGIEKITGEDNVGNVNLSQQHPPGSKVGAYTVTADGRLKDRIGHVHDFYDGKPCEVCGNSNFIAQSQANMHRAWHVKNGKAKWSAGDTKHRYLIPTGGAISVPQEQSGMTQVPPDLQQISIQPELIHECDDTRALQMLQQSLTLVNLALAVQRLPAAQAAQLIGTITNLGSAPMKQRR